MVAQIPTTLAIIYSHQSALKHVDSCGVLLLSADVRHDCVRRFDSQAHNL